MLMETSPAYIYMTTGLSFPAVTDLINMEGARFEDYRMELESADGSCVENLCAAA